MNTTSKRIHFIDEVRGFAIICMVFYHLAYSINVFYLNGNLPFSFSFMNEPWMALLRDIFVGIFVFISGTACNFSQNNFKRSLMTLGAALIITFVTYVFIPDQLIIFGILHMLGCCMLIYAVLQPFLNKLNVSVGIILFLILFILTFNILNGYIGFFNFKIMLPNSLYDTNFLFPLGFISNDFMSADYFPLLPWLFLFLCGALSGKSLAKGKWPNFFYKMHIKPLAVTGRYTIYIYLLHQPIVFGILYLISYIF